MKTLLATFLLFISLSAIAAKDPKPAADDTTVNLKDLMAQIDTLKYQTSGKVDIGSVASVDIPKGFKYLDGKQAAFVLHDLWGNPPQESLGMLIPEGYSPYLPGCWVVDMTYEEDGHVKDDDAKDIKYDELLKQMQEQIKESNPERVKMGSRAIELTGWAEQPSYDASTHKLYWAKKIKAVDDSLETLNYNIRILGRKGVLVLNAIGDLDQLNEIKANNSTLLQATNFTKGNTYEEFNSSIDKVAAYGIAGLIAGGILAKTGLLAKVGIVLLKLIKPIIVGIGAIGAWIARKFKGRKEGDA
ncbi:MAG: DUF2167 domain-containing protein [Bacteroidetes bacterium]|nr:DUF2167 domain-containing protein [Bacteroidota bacterium]